MILFYNIVIIISRMDKLEKSFIELLEKDQNEAYVEARKLIDQIYREVPELS